MRPLNRSAVTLMLSLGVLMAVIAPSGAPAGAPRVVQLGDGRDECQQAQALEAVVTWDRALVDLIGLALIAFIAWFFWLVKTKGVRAATTSGGYQEQLVLVKGGYTPDVIVVEHGKPVRLNFLRQESASCSEMVLLPAFGKSAKLPEGQTVAVEFLPRDPGEFEFACQMGMFRGKLIVE